MFGTGKRPVSWISVDDVARFVARATGGGEFARQILPLGGPESLSPIDVLRIFESLGSSRVVVEHVPERILEAQLVNARDPLEEALAGTALAVARGLTVSAAPALALLPGRMKSVRDYARALLAASE
jgi:uncharacterized protein YbjT (DUF2867 family)